MDQLIASQPPCRNRPLRRPYNISTSSSTKYHSQSPLLPKYWGISISSDVTGHRGVKISENIRRSQVTDYLERPNCVENGPKLPKKIKFKPYMVISDLYPNAHLRMKGSQVTTPSELIEIPQYALHTPVGFLSF